jgi:trk system potassium uptake protein TrkA
MARRNRRHDDAVAILGLGRFGTSLALELMKEDVEVLAVDADQRIVESLAGRLTQVVSADTTSEEALRQLSVHEFHRVVIAVGTHLEASILTATVCLGFETPEIWAKAISEPHAKILSQLGVHHIVRPEHDMGKRVAHLVAGRMMDYMEFDDGYAMVKTTPPSAILGQPLRTTEVRKRFGVTIVAIKRPGEDFTYATPETVVNRGDVIIASGKTHDVEYFSDQG